MAERITATMSIMDALYAVSEGNPGALTTMLEMLNSSETALFDILWFDTMEIYGSKIYKLWNDCCGRDIQKLFETIQYLHSGEVSKEKIHENLNQCRATPFI